MYIPTELMASACLIEVTSTEPWADLTLFSHSKCWFVAFYKRFILAYNNTQFKMLKNPANLLMLVNA